MRTITLLLLLSLFALPLAAAEDGALSLSPAVVMLRGEFGQSTTQTLTLTNGTSRAFSFDLVAQDVIAQGGKRVFVDAGATVGSIAATAVFSTRHVELAPGETTHVTVTVTLPPSTEERAMVALFRGTNRVMSGLVPMTASLGSLLTFSVSDEVEMSATPLDVRPQSASAALAVRHACTNAGREPLVARGVMAVVDARGTLVGKSPLTPKRLLPGESAEVAGEYGGDLTSGRYRVLVTYDYEGRTLTQSADVEIP